MALALSLVWGCSTQDPSPETIAQHEAPIVFGQDNRVEFGALSDSRLIGWANATAALFPDSGLTCSASNCTLLTSPLTQGDVGGGAFVWHKKKQQAAGGAGGRDDFNFESTHEGAFDDAGGTMSGTMSSSIGSFDKKKSPAVSQVSSL